MRINLLRQMESCSNFLCPTCPYTECRLNFQTGSCPTERTTASYSSYWFLILLTCLVGNVLIFRACYTLPHLVGICFNAAPFVTSSFSGYFPEPCPNPGKSEPRQDSGILMFPILVILPVFSSYYNHKNKYLNTFS